VTLTFFCGSSLMSLLVCPPETAEGDADEDPSENPAETERSSSAERGCGVS